ncbi:hypothetical protein DTL42_10590 [Bremerella cremea]|uniref:Uncharacterized protein n=1 Tax=Bremerella cremea TaxID=1031537 RepID=A0A368KUI1_9BACT|nr:hypothetical protein [Bremerella cremea]RCS50550.1 hypothetical protein DTL42_10590 [Bremerella cremea]
MSDRNQALAILKQARDALLARMTEAILDQADEIQADAAGESFLSEIENLYDRMGNKLAHLNQMISNLPAEQEEAEESQGFERYDQPSEKEAVRLPHFPLTITPPEDAVKGSDRADLIGLPAPGTPLPQAPAFGRFVTLIEQGNVEEAGDLIAQILGISPYSGLKCAQAFSANYQRDTTVVVKAMRIRHELVRHRFNDALILMHECFGLQGIEAMVALQKMRDILASPANS